MSSRVASSHEVDCNSLRPSWARSFWKQDRAKHTLDRWTARKGRKDECWRGIGPVHSDLWNHPGSVYDVCCSDAPRALEHKRRLQVELRLTPIRTQHLPQSRKHAIVVLQANIRAHSAETCCHWSCPPRTTWKNTAKFSIYHLTYSVVDEGLPFAH